MTDATMFDARTAHATVRLAATGDEATFTRLVEQHSRVVAQTADGTSANDAPRWARDGRSIALTIETCPDASQSEVTGATIATVRTDGSDRACRWSSRRRRCTPTSPTGRRRTGSCSRQLRRRRSESRRRTASGRWRPTAPTCARSRVAGRPGQPSAVDPPAPRP